MRLVLKEFQSDAVDELAGKLRRAAAEVRQSREVQAISLSSPTGSGKTVMVTAALERILQGDEENQSLQDAVFLWITDQPQLNEQTRRKMLKDSSLFTEANLVTIGSAFDQELFTPGTVNFLNIQKLGRERDLITKGDGRTYTIWDTIRNAVEVVPDRFFVIIDEAHRGMREGTQAQSEAVTIIQKFIKGSPDEIPKVPLVLGISATPERFNRLVSGAGRTTRPVDIPIDQIRLSGLLKEVVTLYHPTSKQPTDITMLREAVKSWRASRDEWLRYCQEQNETPVRPILVVQVQDAAARRASKTDLDEVVNAIEDELGGLPAPALAHAFQEGTPVAMNGKDVRYLAPADIDMDLDVEVVFFKTSLNTGWDCPRAEVIMSFRTALDGMVRSPLARRIESNDLLNAVSLYLPHYDEKGLAKVIERLTSPDPDNLPPLEFRRGDNQVTVARAPGLDAIFEAIEQLPSYIVPTQRKVNQLRRLMKLARALANDELEPDAEDTGLKQMMTLLLSDFRRIEGTSIFQKLVEDRTEITIRAVDWQVGLEEVGEDATIKVKVSDENIDDLFEESGRRLGDEGLYKEWWKARRREGIDNTRAKLEVLALSMDAGVRKKLENAAQQLAGNWLRTHSQAIRALPERRRHLYDEIRGLAQDPELHPLVLPTEMAVTKSDQTWKRHIFTGADSRYPATLNTWETAVITEELARDDTTVWLRNAPRKPWAITIPYEVSGKAAPFYPDFVFATNRNGQWTTDLLDPHHIDLADAPAKAVGLAKYAARHFDAFNRIELIIVRGENDIRRIDLTDEAKRERVLAVKTKEHLALLFEEFV